MSLLCAAQHVNSIDRRCYEFAFSKGFHLISLATQNCQQCKCSPVWNSVNFSGGFNLILFDCTCPLSSQFRLNLYFVFFSSDLQKELVRFHENAFFANCQFEKFQMKKINSFKEGWNWWWNEFLIHSALLVDFAHWKVMFGFYRNCFIVACQKSSANFTLIENQLIDRLMIWLSYWVEIRFVCFVTGLVCLASIPSF